MSADLWRRWELDPVELLVVLVPAAWYLSGLRALWRRAGRGRGVTRAQAASFALGVAALLVALASPLDAAAEALFSAHMVQHLVLILAAAPLLVAGAPTLPMIFALPRDARRAAGRWWHRSALRRAALVATSPYAAFALHTVALWTWHFPVPYQLALQQPAVHALEHASFLGTAALFWWCIIAPIGRRHRSEPLGIVLLGLTLAQSGALGAVLLLARAPWYPAHAAATAAWGSGRTLLEDQQLAGLMMWVPAGVVYVGAAAWLFLRWMRRVEQSDARELTMRAPRVVAGTAGEATA